MSMHNQARLIDIIESGGQLIPVYAKGCKPDLCDITIGTSEKFFGKLVDVLQRPSGLLDVYGIMQECAKGPFNEYVAKTCHYPWGVSDNVRFKILNNARTCNETKCLYTDLKWSGTAWQGSYDCKRGSLNLKLTCVSDTQGPNPPNTLADDPLSGTVTWNNPGNAQLTDNIYADAPLLTNEETHFLVATNFGFTIPLAGTVDAVQVEVQAKADGTNAIVDIEVVLVLGGIVFSSSVHNSDALPTTRTKITYSGDNVYWGVPGFTPSTVNDPTFGVAIRYKNTSSAAHSVFVDSISITVICPALFYLETSGCVNPPETLLLSKECDYPLVLGAQLGLPRDCCEVPVGTVTDPIDFVIYGFRKPYYAARLVDFKNDLPVYGFAECCTRLACAFTACCDMQPFQSNIPTLIATFSNLSGTCVCLPGGCELTWNQFSDRWEAPGIATCPLTECEEATFFPFLDCCDYGIKPAWQNFRWTEACMGSDTAANRNPPVAGSCDPFMLVFGKTINGGSYTVTITRP